jgi:hypothetical protein
MIKWLLLTYKLPSEPSARRVYIWRKLKRLGAITIFDAVWVLPDTPRTHEQFQWLATEIQELGGEAMFWKAQAELAGQEENLVEQFRCQVEEIYRALLERMDQNRIEPIVAAQEYQQIRQKDYFQSEGGLLLRERLLASREDPPREGEQ